MAVSAHLLPNEINQALGYFCAHIGSIGPGEAPEDGEMSELTLSFRHRIQNANPGGLRPSTLPLGHGGSPQYFYEIYEWMGNKDFCFFLAAETGKRTPNSSVKGSSADHYTGAPALIYSQVSFVS